VDRWSRTAATAPSAWHRRRGSLAHHRGRERWMVCYRTARQDLLARMPAGIARHLGPDQ
jgi:hypothetical protein